MSGDRATGTAPDGDDADLLTRERVEAGPDAFPYAGATATNGHAPAPQSAWQQRLAKFGYRAPARRTLREQLVPAMPDGRGVPIPPPSATLQRLGVNIPAESWLWLCRWSGWLGPLLVTLFGAVLVFTHLGTPHDIIFDETYYAKDSWAVWHYGFEVNWADTANAAILADPHHLPTPTGAAFIAHPPAGKWVIGIGEMIFGLTPLGWRFMVALLGSLAVLMLCRIGRRLFRSTLLGCVAGLLMCVDGMHLVMSRTGLLDLCVMFWALCGFGLLLVDRDRSRARLADRVGATVDNPGALPDHDLATRARLGLRPLRILAGVCLGMCCATKWNGAIFLACFAVMTVLWDAAARKTAGSRNPYLSTLVRDTLPAFVSLVVVAFFTYLASWSGWLINENTKVGSSYGGYDRHWAPDQGGTWNWISGSLRSLWHYHAEIWHFNTTLTTPHTYMSNPWSWLLNARPVSFYYPNDLKPAQCGGAAQCSSEVLAIGTPLLWWASAFALLYALYRWILRRDWRAGAICCGIAAGYAPWFGYQQRTIFLFYSIAFEPYLCLAVALMIGGMLGSASADRDRRLYGVVGAGALVIAIMATFLYFLPLYDAQIIPMSGWLSRMWWPSWV